MIVDSDLGQVIIEQVKQASLLRLSKFSRREDLALGALVSEPMVYAHWMSLILISGKDLRITFKAHFNTDAARHFASKIYRQEASEVASNRAIDFMKEYCNLTAGHLKVLLHKSGLKVGVSLPALARGFDEVFYLRPVNSSFANWRLSTPEGHIDCSLHLQLFSSFQFKLENDAGNDNDDMEYHV